MKLFNNENSEAYTDLQNEDENKYIIFKLCHELYAIKLLSIKEVVEVLPIKSVPNTVKSFKGVCNLRGQIIGVIDLKTRFNLSYEKTNRPVLLIFELSSCILAAEVDEISAITLIHPIEIQSQVEIISNISLNFIKGIAKHENKLITILDLHAVMNSEEIHSIENSKIINYEIQV